ncbi:MAG: hypothetical protein V7K77_25775 [Nostoc sp.]|uniref:hypothetical protein n=1 Tax=Nostoc sp. TaxID=1180 RepID=UPI002FF69E01
MPIRANALVVLGSGMFFEKVFSSESADYKNTAIFKFSLPEANRSRSELTQIIQGQV